MRGRELNTVAKERTENLKFSIICFFVVSTSLSVLIFQMFIIKGYYSNRKMVRATFTGEESREKVWMLESLKLCQKR